MFVSRRNGISSIQVDVVERQLADPRQVEPAERLRCPEHIDCRTPRFRLGHEPGHRLASPRDHDLLPGFDPFHEGGKVGLGLGDLNPLHGRLQWRMRAT
jgi:hypothetical protein